MKNLNDLLNKIKKVSRKRDALLIGIDGFGGSGKSTVAKFLKENLDNTIIVEMDDFYSPSLKRADYIRLNNQVLQPLANNLDASYQRYDWESDSLAEWHNIKTGGIVIIEGVYSMHKNIIKNYDFKIWVDCPQEIGFKRGSRRDKIRDAIDNSDKWLSLWMPKEKEYVETQNPQRYADYIIDGTIFDNNVNFAPSSKFKPIADKVFAKQKVRILSVIPNAKVHHIGSTAISGSITKGDIDMNVRVRKGDFQSAVEQLKKLYEINQLENWTDDFASFKDEKNLGIDFGLQLTVIGSQLDDFVKLKNIIANNPKLLAKYNAMKIRYEGKSMDTYRKKKSEFFQKLREDKSKQ